MLFAASLTAPPFTVSPAGYYAYGFWIVDKSLIPVVAGYSRAAILCGRFLAGVVGQVFVAIHPHTDYIPLYYVSFFNVALAVVCAFLLPTPRGWRCTCKRAPLLQTAQRTEDPLLAAELSGKHQGHNIRQDDVLYRSFLRLSSADEEDEGEGHTASPIAIPISRWQQTKEAFIFAWRYFWSPSQARWLLWWGLAMCAYLQVENYYQNLWDITLGHRSSWNGLASAAATSCGALAALLPDLIHRCRHRHSSGDSLSSSSSAVPQRKASDIGFCDEAFVGGLCLFMAAALAVMAELHASAIAFSYISYVVFSAFYAAQAAIVSGWLGVACRELESKLLMDGPAGGALPISSSNQGPQPLRPRLGFVLGVGTFLGLAAESLLTFLVGSKVLDLEMRPQFRVYAGFVAALPVLLGVEALLERCCCKRKSQRP